MCHRSQSYSDCAERNSVPIRGNSCAREMLRALSRASRCVSLPRSSSGGDSMVSAIKPWLHGVPVAAYHATSFDSSPSSMAASGLPLSSVRPKGAVVPMLLMFFLLSVMSLCLSVAWPVSLSARALGFMMRGGLVSRVASGLALVLAMWLTRLHCSGKSCICIWKNGAS